MGRPGKRIKKVGAPFLLILLGFYDFFSAFKSGTYKSKCVISVDGETLADTEYKVTYSDNAKVKLADNETEKTVTVTITSKEKNFKAGSIIRTYSFISLRRSHILNIFRAVVAEHLPISTNRFQNLSI